MVDLTIDMSKPIADIQKLTDHAKIADKAAVQEVARSFVVPAMKAAVSFTGPRAPMGMLGIRTGRLHNQVKARFFRGRDGMWNASVRVIGDRAYIAKFNEKGTSKHGKKGGPLPARRMFATVGAALRSAIEARMVAEFERNMRALGH